MPAFLEKTKSFTEEIYLTDENNKLVNIDAEVPVSFLTPELFNLLDIFEPFGNENAELLFFTAKIKLCDAQLVGKKDPMHLKLSFDTGKFKIVAMFWGQGERLGKDIVIGNTYDILYNMGKNTFNGFTTNQIIIKDLQMANQENL